MNWYYALDGHQKGPISADQLEILVRAGSVTGETLVWHDGLPNWIKYSLAGGPVSTPVEPASPDSLATCAECGQQFPVDETILFSGSRVCAGCKPLFFQKLQEGVATGSMGMWRSKKTLVTSLNSTFPRRCVKCNEPTENQQMKRNLYWHPPLVYIALLLNIIIYAVVAMITRKKAVAMISVCTKHRSARRNAIITGWVLTVGGFASIIAGAANDMAWLAIAGGIAFLGGLIYGIARGRLVGASKIDAEHVWVSGCHLDFLAEFPEWTGPK